MKRLWVICMLLTWATVSSAQDAMEVSIKSLADKYISKHPQSQLVIGLIVNGRTQYFSFGKASSESVDTTSVFEIGQITQSFTSVLFADLVIAGQISSDDSLQKYLPVDVPSPVYLPLVCKPAPKQEDNHPEMNSKNTPVFVKYTPYVCFPDPTEKQQPIILCYLSTHTSGLPDLPSNLKGVKSNPYANYSQADLYSFLRSFELTAPIGYNFRHSTLGVALLGHVMELKTSKSYDSLLSDRFFQRLGMINSGICRQELRNDKMLNGYTSKGRPSSHWTYNFFAPALGAYSNLGDMMRFLSANMMMVKSPMKYVLDYTHNPRILFQNKKYGESSVALGWMVSPLNIENTTYVWQEGLTSGFASFIGFTETTGTGVVIMTNTADPVTEIGKEILRKLN